MLYTSGSTEKTVFDRYVGTAMTPSQTLAGSLATPTSSADPSRTDVHLHVRVGAHGKPWALLGHEPGYAFACAYGLPPTATVVDLRSKRIVLWSYLTENFPDLFRGSLWLHLVNGSSSVIQGDILIDAT